MIEESQTVEQFTPVSNLVINDLETLKVISHPLRLQILQMLLGGPRTVKEVAEEIGSPPNKLYYHFNLLEQHGLLRVVSTRIVSGIVEKSYHVTAYSVSPAPELLGPTAQDAGEGFSTMLAGVFQRSADDIRRSIAAGLIDPANIEGAEPTFLLAYNMAQLSPQQAQVFLQRLQDLLKEINSSSKDNKEEDRVYAVTLAFYPTTYRGPLPKGKQDE